MNLSFKFAAVLFYVSCLTACGSGFEGTYSDERGMSEYKFQSDGTVSISVMGSETEMPFEMEDNKIKIGVTDDAKMVLTLGKDDTINGPGGVKLVRAYYLDDTFRHEESGVAITFEPDGTVEGSEDGEADSDMGSYIVRGNKIILKQGNNKQTWLLLDKDTIQAGDPDYILRRD